MTSIFDEYRRFAGSKVLADQEVRMFGFVVRCFIGEGEFFCIKSFFVRAQALLALTGMRLLPMAVAGQGVISFATSDHHEWSSFLR
jgi:hypothetical protein